MSLVGDGFRLMPTFSYLIGLIEGSMKTGISPELCQELIRIHTEKDDRDGERARCPACDVPMGEYCCMTCGLTWDHIELPEG